MLRVCDREPPMYMRNKRYVTSTIRILTSHSLIHNTEVHSGEWPESDRGIGLILYLVPLTYTWVWLKLVSMDKEPVGHNITVVFSASAHQHYMRGARGQLLFQADRASAVE